MSEHAALTVLRSAVEDVIRLASVGVIDPGDFQRIATHALNIADELVDEAAHHPRSPDTVRSPEPTVPHTPFPDWDDYTDD